MSTDCVDMNKKHIEKLHMVVNKFSKATIMCMQLHGAHVL